MYCINGNFMTWKMQGIVRFGREILQSLDSIVKPGEMMVAIPSDANDLPVLKNITITVVGKHGGVIWEQVVFANYLRTHRDLIPVNLCNTRPLIGPPGITVIHDIMYKVLPNNYTTLRNRISRLWHVFQYRAIIKKDRMVATVSEFSKAEILQNYPEIKSPIVVIPNSWEHVRRIKKAPDWRERYPFLEPNRFYFTLATLARNKNGSWVIEAARRNPESIFAIAGDMYEVEYDTIPKNVHFLGYITDEDIVALYSSCKAFIFPSLYEGFGIPPLEALALGAKVISSDRASLPEVLGDSVHYIDPNCADVDLETLLCEKVSPANAVLNKYSYEKSASSLLAQLKNLSHQ